MKRNQLNKYLNSTTILIFLFLCGVMVFLLKPAWAMEGGKKFDFVFEYLRKCKSFTLLDDERFKLFSGGHKESNLCLKYVGREDGSMSEIELFDVNTTTESPIIVDDNAWLIGVQKDYEVLLINIFDQNGVHNPGLNVVHSPEWKRNLLSKTTKVGKQEIHGFSIDDSLEDGFGISVISDSIKVLLSKKYAKILKYTNVYDYKDNPVLQEIADSLTYCLDEDIDIQDAFKIYSNTNRAAWFRNVKKNSINNLRMVGKNRAISDLNNNDKKELVVSISGNRYVPDVLVCYELETRKVLWERAIYEGVVGLDVADIDGDGIGEVIIGTQSHGSEMGSLWFEFENPYDRYHCSLTILDNEGKTKVINNKEMHYVTGTFSWWTIHCILPDNRVLFGAENVFDDTMKKLKVLDGKTGQIDTLDIEYHDLIKLFVIDKEIVMIHSDTQHFYKTILDKDLNIVKEHSTDERLVNYIKKNCWFYHEGERYWIFNDLAVFDEEMNLLYRDKDYKGIYGLQKRGNQIFFNAKDRADNDVLMRGTITRNTAFNLKYVVIWIMLLLIYLVYIFTKTLFNLPAKVLDGSYAVLYNFFGFLYNWRIFGAGRMYKQPVIGSFKKNKFYNMIDDFADSYKEVQVRNLGFIKLHYYRLIVGNEMHIIQRIAHDIKNQMHLMNMHLEEIVEENEEVSDSLKQLYEKTEMLSDFSRINLMEKKKVDIISVIDFVLIRFSNHPRYHNIKWDPPEKKSIIEGDENLLQIAFLNLIENSIRYSPEGTMISVMIYIEDKIKIIIKNKIKSGDIKGIKGSGIGTQVSEKIISSQGGEISFLFSETAEVEIKFPMINEEKYE